MSDGTPALGRADTAVRDIGLELTLGLGPEDAALRLGAGSLRQDLQPWLLDATAVRISCLGHQDEVPRPWDWENVLTLLEPGEELLYVLEHSAGSSGSTGGSFSLWLAIRFVASSEVGPSLLALREKRSRVLVSQLQRQAFPGTQVTWIGPAELLNQMTTPVGPQQRCMAITGMPSPRTLEDDAREVDRATSTYNYQSLNDVVEALYDLNTDYRIAFTVQRLSNHELALELGLKTSLYDRIHPMVEHSYRAGSNWGTQVTQNSSTSTAEGDSKTTQTGQSSGTTLNGGILAAAAGAVAGTAIGGPPGAAIGMALAALVGVIGINRTRNSSTSNGTTWTTTHMTGVAESSTEGGSSDTTVEHVNSLLRLADRSLERTIEAMHEASGTGAYRWAAFAFADGHDVEIVSRSLMGVLSGSRTKDHPLTRVEVEGEHIRLLAGQVPTMSLLTNAAPILSLPRVCDALLVPEAELPGLRLRRNVFFGRNVSAEPDADGSIDLGPDAFSAVAVDATPSRIRVPGGDLFKHVLVAGTTGSGKTTRVVEVLNGLTRADLSIVVFETAKRTYRGRFRRPERVEPLVYTLGNSQQSSASSAVRPLRINPFYFELGTSLKRHIAVLSDAIAELMPTEAMIGPLLRRAIEACYVNRGWEIETGQPQPSRPACWPTIADFVVEVRRVAARLRYGAEITANYRGALESRAGLFLDATYQDIFGYGGNTPIDQLFPQDRDAIVEVEDLPPSEVDIRAFVMTLVLARLRSVQGARRLSGALARIALPNLAATPEDVAAHTPTQPSEQRNARHVVDEVRHWLLVVEEAHNVLDRQFEERRADGESNAGRTLLRTMVRLLQEGREMGIGVMVIDQSPSRLARDVIANTGTKIVMRLEDAAEMAEVGRAMGLDEEAWKKLGFLQVGEALIKASYMDRPAKSSAYPVLTRHKPVMHSDADRGAPAHARLAQAWRSVFSGKMNRPGDEWLDSLLDLAIGNVHCAAFAGLRMLLTEHGEQDQQPVAPALLAALAVNVLTAAELLSVAQQCWSEAVNAHYHSELSAIAAHLCDALEPSRRWQCRTPSHDGVTVATELFASAKLGDRKTWHRYLAPYSRGHVTNAEKEALREFLRSVSPTAPTAPIRALLRHNRSLREFAARGPEYEDDTRSRIGAELANSLTSVSPDLRADEQAATDRLLEELEKGLFKSLQKK